MATYELSDSSVDERDLVWVVWEVVGRRAMLEIEIVAEVRQIAAQRGIRLSVRYIRNTINGMVRNGDLYVDRGRYGKVD